MKVVKGSLDFPEVLDHIWVITSESSRFSRLKIIYFEVREVHVEGI